MRKIMIARRFAGIVFALLAVCFVQSSDGRGLRGGVASGGGGGGTLLTTMTLVNTSGSTQSSDFVTDIFGHPFKKGDISNGCSGGAPQFQLTNGTNVPFSEGLAPICWSDGSLKWAPFMLRVPTSIAGSGTLTINILSGGTTPSSSSRTLSDFSAGGTDLNIDTTGLTGVAGFGNLSGNWNCNLNQGIGAAHTDDYVYMDGPPGRVWRVRASMRQSSADHGQLECYWYVQSLQASGGGLYGLRTLERITQPWYSDSAGTKNWRAFSTMQVKNGATVIRDEFASNFGTGRNFTWASGATCSPWSNCLVSASHQLTDGLLVKLTNSGGSLPQVAQFTGHISGTTLTIDSGVTGTVAPGTEITSGATAGTIITAGCCGGVGGVYTVSISQTVSSTAMVTKLSSSVPYFTFAPITNSFQIGETSKGNGIDSNVNCSGTCTATPYPFVTQFGSLFPQGSTGKADYIQGAGSSASDHTTRIQFNNTYWRSTRMVPPYQIGTVTPPTQTSYSFSLMGHDPVLPGLGTTGERPDLGVFTDWSAGHFYTQDAGSTQTVRTVALVGGQIPINLKNTSTFTGPVVNNTTYSGLPAPNITFRWIAVPGQGSFVSGFTQPVDTNVYEQVFSAAAMDHMPEFEYYATLVFGEPQFYDMTVEWGGHSVETTVGPTGFSAIVNGTTNSISGISNNGPGGRDTIISGTHYYGLALDTGSGLRGEAWQLRALGMGCAMSSSYGINAANFHTYLCDNLTANYQAYNAYTALLPSFAQNAGFFYEPGSFGGYSAPWEVSYHVLADNLNYAMTEIPAILTFASYMAKFPQFVDTNFGVYMVTCYYCLVRTGTTNIPAGNDASNPYIGSTALFGGGNTTFSTSWTPTQFTLTSAPHNYAPRNGDQMNFGTPSGNSVPAGFSAYTQYWIVSASGNNFQLSATQGGAPITITDSGSNNQSNGGIFFFPSTNDTYSYPGTGSGYLQSIACGMNWTNALGGTVDATALGHVNTNLQSITGYITAANATPKYSCGGTFLVPVNDNDEEFLPIRSWRKVGVR